MSEVPEWLTLLLDARGLFEQRQYKGARSLVSEYRKNLEYSMLPMRDGRGDGKPAVSIVIVSYAAGEGLLRCLDSVEAQTMQDFEIILVDNGKNESIHKRLAGYKLLHVRMPENIPPAEARNIGVHFARAGILVFLDDDGVAEPSMLQAVCDAFDQFEFLAIRGRVLPLDDIGGNKLPGHYDLGPYPIPAILETEGNAAVLTDAWRLVKGMDPLLFGAEGAELSVRLLDAFPGRDIYYWPAMTIQHDFATGKDLAAKKKRHNLAAEYFKIFCPEALNISYQYGRWYQERPGTGIRYDQRSLGARIKAALYEVMIRIRNKRRPEYVLPRRSREKPHPEQS